MSEQFQRQVPILCSRQMLTDYTLLTILAVGYKRGFGYLSLLSPIEELAKRTFFIEVEKKQHEAILQTKPLHDPENKIIKS